ncbi:MAG TPA: hypothetical protein VGE20_08650 [Ramlibacter sp.]
MARKMKAQPRPCWNALPLAVVAAIYLLSGFQVGYFILAIVVLLAAACLYLKSKQPRD